MPPTDAVAMENWWPEPYGCRVRNGYQLWNTGLGGSVQTLATWNGLNGAQKLFGWANTSMFDCSVSGAIGAAIVTGLSNALWQTTGITNVAGNWLIAVNGVDNGIIYSAGGVARLTAGDGIVANTWAGLNPANAVQVCVHQQRLWAVEKNTMNGWYLPTNNKQGTFVSYAFGGLFERGGSLEFLTTWTLDDGNGAEDHLVACSSEGEVAVFAGTNPASTTGDWVLVGVYYVGAPVVGRRSYTKAAGDILFITQQGVVSMTSELISTKVDRQQDPLTSLKIQFLVSELVSQYSLLAGWGLQYFPKLNMALLNVPSVVAGATIQLAQNLITSAWTSFTGMDAACWILFNEELYYGDYAGNVQLAWTGNSDGAGFTGSGGTSIVSRVQQAYNYFDGMATQKQVSMYQPVFVVVDQITVASAITYDFSTRSVAVPGAAPAPTTSLWNTALWNTAIWGGGDVVQKNWIQANGMGVAASIQLALQTDTEVLWVSTNYSMIKGRGLL
jgi:hypothetical protein